jgi:hypothetical protein
MGSKEPEPWSPQWVRQKHREKNNGLPIKDPNHNDKPLTDAGRPLYKCELCYVFVLRYVPYHMFMCN